MDKPITEWFEIEPGGTLIQPGLYVVGTLDDGRMMIRSADDGQCPAVYASDDDAYNDQCVLRAGHDGACRPL